jgi:DNA-binding SARP family transcriptional activator
VEYRILGPLEVLDGGWPLDVGAPRQRAVLAVLLLHANEVVTNDRLAEALWPEGSPRTAAKAIQVHVSALRKALQRGRDALETRGAGYLLRVGAGELDLHEFERLLERSRGEEATARAKTLRTALALWRGAALTDFAYEAFAQQEIARLEELRRLALEERIEAEFELGGGAELVAELRMLVSERPLEERPRALLMRALYRAGRQSEALDVFREGRRLLDEELGLEPGPELRQLERAILRQDAALAAAGVPAAEEQRGCILAVPDTAAALTVIQPLLEALARRPIEREVVVVRVVSADEIASATAELRAAREELVRGGTRARVAAFSSSSPGHDIARLAGQLDSDLVVLSSSGDPLSGPLAGVFEQATCDVAFYSREGGRLGDGSVAVPFGAFEHDWAALEVGAWVATGLDRPLRLIGGADEGHAGRDASRVLADASLIVQHTIGVIAEPVLGPPGREGIAALAAGAGLLVVGLSDRWRSEGLGALRASLVTNPPAPTILVRRGVRPSGIAPPASRTRFTWSIARPSARG